MRAFKQIRFYIVVLAIISTGLKSQILLKITSLPKETPENAKIFMASSLNNWNPNDQNFELKKDSSGNYTINLPKNEGTVEYKFTQGSWETAEGDENGNKLDNRKLVIGEKDQTIANQILSWEHIALKQNTAANNVKILSENFTIPQLKTTRRIWIYFPPDYSTSNKKYPVIYMHDAQNLS